MKVLIVIVLFLGLIQGSPIPNPINLDADTVWVVSPTEEYAIQLAINDVAKDWYKVVGVAPTILNSPPSSWRTTIVFLGCRGPWWSSFKYTLPRGNETFIVGQQVYAGAPAVFATGSDLRGTIYAIYSFSEQILGVDPQWFWIDLEPEYQGTISVPAGYSFIQGPPTFAYRGWFTNDEDLLGGFASDPLGEQVFDSATWDKIYQTILRMKGNLFIVGTVPFPDERSITLAAKRGLVVTNHHFNLLGINTFRWPQGVPFSFPTDPEVQLYVWEACVRAQMGNEMLWSIGYRGLNDYPFWNDDPEVNTDLKRAAVINQAMANQTALVKRLLPNSNPKFIFYLWSEMSSFYFNGLLNIPEGVTVVWSDDGTGMVPDADKAFPGAGLYYHVMMYNGVANQLSEMVPPRRIFEQIGNFVKKNATSILMINLSDVRPVPLGTLATMQFAWNASAFMSMSPEDAETRFFEYFAQTKYGNAELAEVLAAYFAIGYMANSNPNATRIADNYFASALRDFSAVYLNAIQNPVKYTQELLNAANNYEAATNLSNSLTVVQNVYNSAVVGIDKVRPSRVSFYTSHIVLQAGIHLQALLSLNATIYSARAFANKDVDLSTLELNNAIVYIEQIFAYERAAEYGRWRGFFQSDILTGFPTARTSLRIVYSAMVNQPAPIFPGGLYYDWYNYQLAFDNYPYIYNSTARMDFVVSILCQTTTRCINTPVGGNFTTSTVSLQMTVERYGLQIRYTLDGSMPSTSSPIYTSPITISNTTTVTAASFGNNVTFLPSRTVWFYNAPTFVKQPLNSINIQVN